MKLTKRQECFVAEYLVDLDAMQAAIRAGYNSKRANAMGHENLTKPDIAAAVQAAMAARVGADPILTHRRSNPLGLRDQNETD